MRLGYCLKNRSTMFEWPIRSLPLAVLTLDCFEVSGRSHSYPRPLLTPPSSHSLLPRDHVLCFQFRASVRLNVRSVIDFEKPHERTMYTADAAPAVWI